MQSCALLQFPSMAKTSKLISETAVCAPGVDGAVTQLAVGKFDNFLAMNPGAEHESYCKNSEVQAYTVNKIWLHHLIEALELVSLPTTGPVVLADLGCSSGPNTISVVSLIVEKLRARFISSSPEFLAYFNDLPSNDFNNLFQLLTADSRNRSDSGLQFFGAGVPGSIFDRLFPRQSVHIIVSFHCIHWMSKIPDVILDKSSPAYNRGKFSANNSSPEALAAFQEQSSLDFKQFLAMRAEELRSGGLLFLGFGGRSGSRQFDDPVMDACWESLDEVWSELVSEGILMDEQRDTFNFPVYLRTIKDIQHDIENYTSVFHIHKIQLMSTVSNYVQIFQTEDPVALTEKFVGMFRSTASSSIESHIGKNVMDVFWEKYRKLVEKNVIPLVLKSVSDEELTIRVYPVVVLVRK